MPVRSAIEDHKESHGKQAAPWQKGCGECLSEQMRKLRDVREGIPDLGPVYQRKTDLKLKEGKS